MPTLTVRSFEAEASRFSMSRRIAHGADTFRWWIQTATGSMFSVN